MTPTEDDTVGLAEERGEPLPVIGGPLDGSWKAITYVLPFLGGGVPAEVFICVGHIYRLSADRTRWEHAGTSKQPEVKP